MESIFDKEMAYNVLSLIIDTLNIIQKRTKNITSPQDFTSSENGMILLDSTCMKLAAVGESIKNLDKITNKELLFHHPEINWKQAMGMRDIIVHHYFDIDVEVIFKTLREDIPLLLQVLEKIQSELYKQML
jgi:uncharacterized protein with HEPN domain